MVVVSPFTWYMTILWNSLLQDIMENNYLSGSNKAPDNEKPLLPNAKV